MARDIEVGGLTDDERLRLLEAAVADEREGRLVRCSTADEVRDAKIGIRTVRPKMTLLR